MARDWRRYAKHLEAMLAAEQDMLRISVHRAVVIELGARSWLQGEQRREAADAITGHVLRNLKVIQ